MGHGLREFNGRFDAAVNGVGVFGAIRNFVTENSLQAQMERVDHELKILSAQGNDFVANLDKHLVKIEAVEKDFKQHVQSNFATVEKELNMIKHAVDGVAGKGDVNSNVAQRVVMLEVNMQKEVAVINGNIQTLKAGVESVPLLISSAMYAKCHCVHVDQLDGRLAVLEVAAAAATGAGKTDAWQGGTDPWRGYAVPGSAPMKAPPGYGGNGAGDGGDGGAPPNAPKANAQFPDMEHVNLSRLFDDKIALSDSYSFDGVKGGDAWREKLRGYWVPKCSELKPTSDYRPREHG